MAIYQLLSGVIKARSDYGIAALPVHFFVAAIVSLAAGLIGALWEIPQATVFFYQPGVLALVHTFTLGWISAAIMGVMYAYVPALTHRQVRYPRLGIWQFATFVVGASGMVSHFALGSWAGVWSSAIVAIVSIALFAINMMGCLWANVGGGITESGLFGALCFLIAAAVLGFALALDKSVGFLSGDVITNLAAHAHLAAIGWVTLAICAMSYRLLPAFLLPKRPISRAALWQFYLIAIGGGGLATDLLLGWRGAVWWSAIIAIALLSYLATVAKTMRTRRNEVGWAERHALGGVFWMLAAVALGVVIAGGGAQSEAGARLASAYGAAGLMGFFGNFIIGMSYRLFPGFVARARKAGDWRAMTVAELAIRGPRWFVFGAYNVGIAAVAAGLLAGSAAIAEAGAAVMAAGGLIYCGGALRTLGYAYRRG